MKKRYWIIVVISIYLLLVFVVPLLLLSGFLREVDIQETEKIKLIAEDLKSGNKEETLENVYEYVRENYEESRYKLFILLNRHFYTDANEILEMKGEYIPCHVQSLILKTLLINTGQFDEKDFERKIVMGLSGVIHEYLLVGVNGEKFKVDVYYNILEEKS